MTVVEEIKKKKELSKIPDSIVERVSKNEGEDVKKSRAFLRKYFGVFLTNKVLKGDLIDEEILKSHISSSRRNYGTFYKEIFEDIKGVNSVVDLGCGANGFSYKYLKDEIGSVDYTGIEAAGQLVEHMNEYFEEKMCLAKAISLDLFKIDEIKKILKRQNKNRIVFLFQVIDALEGIEKNFSKKFIEEIFKECELMVVSWSLLSISGRKKFFTKRKWILKFLEENFSILKDFEKDGERILILEKN